MARNKKLREVTQVTQQQLSALTKGGTQPTLYDQGHQPPNSKKNMPQRKSTSNAYVKFVHKIHLLNSSELLKIEKNLFIHNSQGGNKDKFAKQIVCYAQISQLSSLSYLSCLNLPSTPAFLLGLPNVISASTQSHGHLCV